MTTQSPSGSILETSRLFPWLVILACWIMVIDYTILLPTLGAHNIVIDFDAFYIVSEFIREGRLTEAYNVGAMVERQSELAGRTIFMPWTYPPQFDLLIAPFAYLERGQIYFLFTSATLLAYAAVLARLGGRYFSALALAMLPALLVVSWVGQNGLLLGALIGMTCLLWLGPRNRLWAGVSLGLIVIKPHLALALGLFALLGRHWRVVFGSFAVIGATSLLATLAFGPEIWGTFLEATRMASANMERGLYPLFRMTSVYAAAFTLGAPAGVALKIHLVFALLAVVAVIAVLALRWPLRRCLGVAVIAGLAISPYNYDYDIPVLGIGLALLAVDVLPIARVWEKLGLLAGAWICGGSGLVIVRYFKTAEMGPAPKFLSFGAYGFWLMALILCVILRRRHRAEVAARTPSAATNLPA